MGFLLSCDYGEETFAEAGSADADGASEVFRVVLTTPHRIIQYDAVLVCSDVVEF